MSDYIDAVCESCHNMLRYMNMLVADADSLKPRWKDATEAQRIGVRRQVMMIKSGAVKFPAELHELWMADKFTKGWTLGPHKSTLRMEHPDLMDWEYLKLSKKLKYMAFFSLASRVAE